MADSITIQQGVKGGRTWPITNPDGSPATLTGFSARAQIRKSETQDSTLLATLSASIVGSDVIVQWDDLETRAWFWSQPGWGDVILFDADGDGVLVVWQGQVILDKVVTSRA